MDEIALRKAPEKVTRSHRLPFGAELCESGTRFRVFAPAVDALSLQVSGREEAWPMESERNGWWTLTRADAPAGTLYQYVLSDGLRVPDPASRFQPRDVSGPSEVIDAEAYQWGDGSWSGRPWEETVLYELHVGTFTEHGTFLSAIERLDHLRNLGVTAIELMCLADFAGLWNWGYDGVLLYAPDSAYGRPEDLKALIDAAHARRLMIILDVVYNHFGPEGNYLSKYFPQFCTESEETPWGQALNFEGKFSEVVRELMVQNALYWVEEFHVDGLRLDAAHAMIDSGPKHILDELAERVRALAPDRQVHLILENDTFVPQRLLRDDKGEATCYTAQWNHDMTHLLGASMASRCADQMDADHGETHNLGQALARGYVICAEEQGKRGAADRVLPTAFVAFLQTHDLIGNRVFGDRIFDVASPEAVRAAYAILLLLPQIPMMFMGDEFGASSPFPYFCNFHGDLAEAVRRGRREQLSKQLGGSDGEILEHAPDPEAESTFLSGKLHWEEVGMRPHAEWLTWFRRVLAERQRSITPCITRLTSTCGSYAVIAPGALCCEWDAGYSSVLRMEANICAQAHSGFQSLHGCEVLWTEGAIADGVNFGPWTVRWSKHTKSCS